MKKFISRLIVLIIIRLVDYQNNRLLQPYFCQTLLKTFEVNMGIVQTRSFFLVSVPSFYTSSSSRPLLPPSSSSPSLQQRTRRHLSSVRAHSAPGVPSGRLGSPRCPERATGCTVGHLPGQLCSPAELAGPARVTGTLQHPGDGVHPATLPAALATVWVNTSSGEHHRCLFKHFPRKLYQI